MPAYWQKFNIEPLNVDLELELGAPVSGNAEQQTWFLSGRTAAGDRGQGTDRPPLLLDNAGIGLSLARQG